MYTHRKKRDEEIHVVRVNLACVCSTNSRAYPQNNSELHRKGKTRAPETDMSRPWFELTTVCTADDHSSKELLQQLMILLFGTSTQEEKQIWKQKYPTMIELPSHSI